MKIAAFILTLFLAATAGAQAQSKMAPEQETGRAKYTEVEPLSLVPEANRKKVRLTANARKVEPVAMPAQTEIQLAQQRPVRVEGRLADHLPEQQATVPTFR